MLFFFFFFSSKGENWEEKERLKELLLKYGNKYHDNLVSVLLFSQDKEISNEIYQDNHDDDNSSDNLVAIQSMNTATMNMNSIMH